MQIFEITKLSKQRTDEGLLDNFKSAVGLDPTPGPMPTRKDNRTMMQKLSGAPQNKPSDDDEKAYRDQLIKHKEELENYWGKKGYKTGKGAEEEVKKMDAEKAAGALNQAITQVQQDQNTQNQIQGLVKDFDKEFQIGVPDPGTKFVVTANNGQYYKDDKGQWANEQGKSVTKPESIQMLDQLVDGGGAKQISAPPPTPAAPAKGQKQTQPVSESLLVEGRKSLVQSKFENDFVSPKVKGTDSDGQPITFANALGITEVRKRLNKIFQQMVQANESGNFQELRKLFQTYMTTAVAGIQLVKKERNGEDDEDQGPKIQTGDPVADKLSKQITSQGLDMFEKEPEKTMDALKELLKAKKSKGY